MEVTENGQKCDNDSEGLCHGPTSSVSLLCQDGGWEIFIKGDKVTRVFGNPEWWSGPRFLTQRLGGLWAAHGSCQPEKGGENGALMLLSRKRDLSKRPKKVEKMGGCRGCGKKSGSHPSPQSWKRRKQRDRGRKKGAAGRELWPRANQSPECFRKIQYVCLFFSIYLLGYWVEIFYRASLIRTIPHLQVQII